MSRVELTGLIGSHPLGALASFGLLRVLSEKDRTARLSFIERDDWIAVVDSAFGSGDELLAWLREWGQTRAPAILKVFGGEDVRVEPGVFYAALSRAVSEEDGDAELAAFLVALAAHGAKDKSKGLVKPSPFYMASGQQSFLDTMRKLHGHIRKGELWSEALFGPWRYTTPVGSAGWDPGTERIHALRHIAPTDDKKASSVGAAVWLGFEALPLFPSFSLRGRAYTTGWVGQDAREPCWRWPLFSTPIALPTLRVLVASRDVATCGTASNEVRPRDGIAAIYETVRFDYNKGLAVFRPARRLG
jgi:hypothetical protein